MDYFGAEISKKIKSAIRAKLVELGVYVDDELPDYIMVLVANKKTRKQMERDLTLFLNTHTAHFVEWLTQVLDKLQTITLAKEGETEEKSAKKGKEREKKRKSTDTGSDSAKKTKTDDCKDKTKDKKRSMNESRKSKKEKPDSAADHSETEKPKQATVKTSDRPKLKETKEPKGKRSMVERRDNVIDRPVDKSAEKAAVKSLSGSAERERARPRVAQSPPPASPSAAEEEDDEDVLNLSAEEDELVKEAAPTRRSAAVAPTRHTSPPVATAATPAAPPPPPPTTEPSEPPPPHRSRSPPRRRRVQVATESRLRRGPQSTVGAVVSREEEDAGYDPLAPAVGAVASTVRVTERPRRPPSHQPRPTLLLKAMRDAQRSTVASVRPFIVREPPAEGKRHKAGPREREPARRRRSPVVEQQVRAVRARRRRGCSPGRIAITVRNCTPAAAPAAAASPSPSPPPPPDNVWVREQEEPEEVMSASSDEEDTVNVTIGRVGARSQQQKQEHLPAPTQEKVCPPRPRSPRLEVAPPVPAAGRQPPAPAPDTAGLRSASPTFVVTMTGLGASRFARSLEGEETAAEHALEEELVEEEEEEEEEELGEEDLRQQLLEEKARKAAHPAVLPPAPAVEPAPLSELSTRCRFWPGCRLGDRCAYHHPSAPCRAFPACTFGDNCLYLHPACKFDGSCSRPDCRFSHTRPRAAAAPATRPGTAGQECKFFPNCTNPNCTFIHPKLCRYGSACTNPTCLFTHTTPPAAAGRPARKWVAATRAF